MHSSALDPLQALQAIGPVDGRYANKTVALQNYFSEAALIKYRCRVEILYFLAISKEVAPLKGKVSAKQKEDLLSLIDQFTIEDAARIKEIEAVTNHDVKAVEYFLKESFDKLGLSAEKEFVHFGLTSQDINNTAFPLMLKEALEAIYLPQLTDLINKLSELADEWKEIPMLARTHGQPASPTRLGKEIEVFVYRLCEQKKLLEQVPLTAKFGGATGNFNAHHIAFPSIDWKSFGDRFVESLGLKRESVTTQISNYDNLAALFEAFSRIHSILVDMARDVWMYISLGYFKQKIKANEVGSSAMPHKVNPIDFENAEGNLLLSNAIAIFLAQKLPISRLQRDLTDSTVLRNEGLPMAYAVIAFQSLLKGLNKLILHKERIEEDLKENYEVIAEGIQTILRREGYPNPYEALKAFTRTGKAIDKNSMREFVEGLEVSETVKQELLALSPFNYLGI
ncbi:adenylosuccinate lyase [Bacteroidales bacterium KA00251]|nr:adenylosuccinate lyase [Bacteroidales bacterium KA00251]